MSQAESPNTPKQYKPGCLAAGAFLVTALFGTLVMVMVMTLIGGYLWNQSRTEKEPEMQAPQVEEPVDESLLEDEDSVEAPAPSISLDEPLGEVFTVGTMTVRPIPFDVRKFSNPPEIIAYANTKHTAPPASVTITTSGELWTYNANIALMEKGEWISATCTDPNTTAVGVLLGGDGNDGWVRVLINGEEVWRDNMYGEPAAGVKIIYLEASGLTPGTHTIRVETLGIAGAGGGDDISMRFFGFSSMPVSGYEP